MNCKLFPAARGKIDSLKNAVLQFLCSGNPQTRRERNDNGYETLPCLFALSFAALPAGRGRFFGCGEDACPVPLIQGNQQPVYAIVSPAGYHAVDMIQQSPRLDTLAGKKIALVGGSFNAAVTHEAHCVLRQLRGQDGSLLRHGGDTAARRQGRAGQQRDAQQPEGRQHRHTTLP